MKNDKIKVKSMDNLWILYGLGAALMYACMILTYKKLLLMNINPLLLNLFVFIFVSIGFAAWVTISKTKIELSGWMVLFLIAAAIFSLVGNSLEILSTKGAPNPGYATALKSGQVIIITLAAALIFKSDMTWYKIVGVATVIGGIVLISI